jgi:PcRGLX-like N-terminal RIFT barrel domain
VSDFIVPLHISEMHGIQRAREAIRIGVPFPRGLIRDPGELVVTDQNAASLPTQCAPLARWPDSSLKWVLVDVCVPVDPSCRTTVLLRPRSSCVSVEHRAAALLSVAQGERAISIDTGIAQFDIHAGHPGPLASVRLAGRHHPLVTGTDVRLLDRRGAACTAVVDRLAVEESGPIRVGVVAEGALQRDGQPTPLRFKWRFAFVAGSGAVRLDFLIRNTRPALHPGGTWDLGDRGSWLISDVTLRLFPGAQSRRVRWRAEGSSEERETIARDWLLYQDSSGGENWNSPNHIDSASRPTVAFRGYSVTGSPDHSTDASGLRSTPCVIVESDSGWVAASVADFWQNFPKALRWRDEALHIGLFPSESTAGFELQGGEQKRHIVLLDFGHDGRRPAIGELQHPVHVQIDAAWVEASNAVLWFSSPTDGDDAAYGDYVQRIVEGPDAFVAKREIIDEYGWRNFGDVYADHEAVHAADPRRFISHYNNQYDLIFGAFVHFLRSGDHRWSQLLNDAARHTIDIDIYHTRGDKAAFNGGLFWHTDHYLSAATCTHRGYSGKNGRPGKYGGGPSNEHIYTTGLLHYYYLTGDAEAADAVRELADCVLGMDDGHQTLLGLIDSRPTGGASQTSEVTFHRAGRGAGNSINALLDAYTLTREHGYLAKAEEIIQRCIHPSDRIANLQLDDPEHRWSYLVFLQVLGKYLAKKIEWGELDYTFHYARESFLHYALWIADNEVPYTDVLHKVELPTETWPAHDVRKAHVLYLAATYSPESLRRGLEGRAQFFFDRCMRDVLKFPTAYLTRPLTILCANGFVHDYFRKKGCTIVFDHLCHNYDFGLPSGFVPQRGRFRQALRGKVQVVRRELARILRDRVFVVRSRFSDWVA